MAGLETMADDAVFSACAELMQEFKDEKSGEWDSDYWIHLWLGYDDEQAEKEPEAMIDGDWAQQGQVGDTLPSSFANAVGAGMDQLAEVEMEQREDMEHVSLQMFFFISLYMLWTCSFDCIEALGAIFCYIEAFDAIFCTCIYTL